MNKLKVYGLSILLLLSANVLAKDLSNTFLLCKGTESEKLRGVHFVDKKFVADLLWWGATGDSDGFKRLNRMVYTVSNDQILLCSSLSTWDDPTKECRGNQVSYLIDRTTLDYRDAGLIGNEIIRRCEISSFNEIKRAFDQQNELLKQKQLEKESRYKL